MARSLWDRKLAADLLRPRLWRYLSPAARFEARAGASPDVKLDHADLVRVFATHLALAEGTQTALDASRQLLDHMPSIAALQHLELNGQIRGQVDWPRTHERRVTTGDPTLFICSPPERRYDTPLGRLIHLSLRCVAQLGDLSALPATGRIGSLVHETSDQARRLLLHPKLSKVRRVDPSALRHMADLVGRRPLAHSLAQVIQKYVSGIVEGDVDQLRALLEQQFLAPDADAQLFELQVGFDLLDALQDCGFEIAPPAPLLPAGRAPFAVLQRPDSPATIYWQRPAWVLKPDARRFGAWWTTLHENSLSQQPLRPDFVVDLPGIRRRFLIEVKLTSLEEGSPDRDGLRDALAYLLDAAEIFEDYAHPHAMVVAWNSTAAPVNASAAIQVSNQDTWRGNAGAIISGTGVGAPRRSVAPAKSASPGASSGETAF